VRSRNLENEEAKARYRAVIKCAFVGEKNFNKIQCTFINVIICRWNIGTINGKGTGGTENKYYNPTCSNIIKPDGRIHLE
jgi:hypothetical protein